MKIIVYRWNAWNQADIEEGLIHLGCEIIPILEQPSNIEEDTTFTEKVISLLKLHHPCFLFSVNYFPVLAESCHETGITYVSWSCDGSLLAMYHNSVFYETNRIFSFDRACAALFQSLGVSQIWHLPLGVNAARLQKCLKSSPSGSSQQYDMSFVGNLYQNNSYDQISDRLPEYLAGYLDCCLEAQLAISGGNILETLLTPSICDKLEEITDYQRSSQSFAGIRELFASTVLGFKVAALARQKLLQTLALAGRKWNPPATMHLFTSEASHELLVNTHGPVDYFTQMPYIFQNSSINLNSTVPTIQTGIPLRVWDILGCGGFLLTDYQPELLDYFQNETHLAIYEDQEELAAKAEFYMKQESLRRRAAEKSQKLVFTEHTWEIRIQEILDRL